MKECENGHPIENVDGKYIGLVGGVQTCVCGNSFVFSLLFAKYGGDIIGIDGIVSHVYILYRPFPCKSCGRMLGSMLCVCEPQKISADRYEHKKHELMPLGFMRN